MPGVGDFWRVFSQPVSRAALSGAGSATSGCEEAVFRCVCSIAQEPLFALSEAACQDGAGRIGGEIAETVHGPDHLQPVRRDQADQAYGTVALDQAVALAGLPDGCQRG